LLPLSVFSLFFPFFSSFFFFLFFFKNHMPTDNETCVCINCPVHVLCDWYLQ
jgi:hypothetical protein